MLAEYDQAAWHAGDAVVPLIKPDSGVKTYVAEKKGDVWTVYFGSLADDQSKFLIGFTAVQQPHLEYKVTRQAPPIEDRGRLLWKARADRLCHADFKGQQRPYNFAVLPAPKDQQWVYVLPAQTTNGVYPHGGDVRYLVSKDGTSIVDTHPMHVSILDMTVSAEITMGMHSAVVDDAPEDSDVFYVLTRKPATPELVIARQFVYQVGVDGKIQYVAKTADFKKGK